MPDDRETWRLVLRGLDEVARERYCRDGFAASEPETREAIVGFLAEGQLAGGAWERLNVKRAWSVCMRGILSEFYSHPWAWNEIGFGGPAYPRGFMRIRGVDDSPPLEPFESRGATREDPVRVTGDGAS
jgi:hypothetical protein